MEPKPKFHGPAFAGLETSERLSDAQIDLAYYDPSTGWTVEPAEYLLIAGQHSLDPQSLQAEFCIA